MKNNALIQTYRIIILAWFIKVLISWHGINFGILVKGHMTQPVGQYAEHFLDIAIALPIMLTMWSTWSDQDNKLSNLMPSSLHLVTCSTMVYCEVIFDNMYLLKNIICLVLEMFITSLFFFTQSTNEFNSVDSHSVQVLLMLQWAEYHHQHTLRH